MRQLFREQLDLAGPLDKHPHARELEGVDRILRDNPDTVVLVLQDLQHGVRTPKEGREGMSADQVLRAAVLKQMNTLTYDALSVHLADSPTYRAFCGLGAMTKALSRGTLQRNIKRITEESWQKINRILLATPRSTGWKRVERSAWTPPSRRRTSTPRRLSVSIDAATVEDLARGLHEATIRLEAGERWGSAADSGCWVRWTTND